MPTLNSELSLNELNNVTGGIDDGHFTRFYILGMVLTVGGTAGDVAAQLDLPGRGESSHWIKPA
jgi:bacteriocin-like protein